MIRVCPERDARCPHGMSCPYVDGYRCKEGWQSPATPKEAGQGDDPDWMTRLETARTEPAQPKPDRELISSARDMSRMLRNAVPRGGITQVAACNLAASILERMADLIEHFTAAHPPIGSEALRKDWKRRIDHRMNEHLIEMKPDYDDSITGFNEAWKVVDDFFAALAAEQEAKT